MHSEARHVQNLTFEVSVRDHKFYLDAPAAMGGDNKGATPKELLLAGVIGCAGMDVVSMLKKHKMVAQSLVISAEADARKEHPRIFQGITLVFRGDGSNLGQTEFIEAVHLSLTKYCGVTAMIADTVPVIYRVILNGDQIAEGQAKF